MRTSQGFIQDFELGGGGEHDGSRMIVACEKYVPTRGLWGHAPPRKILNLDPLRLLLMQSGTRLLFNNCGKIYTQFEIFLGGGGGGGGGHPLYETLVIRCIRVASVSCLLK